MTFRWTPDTCSCVVDLENDGTFSDWLKKCAAHAEFDGQAFLNEIIKHNKQFSISADDAADKEKLVDNMKAKSKEKNKIAKMGKVKENNKNKHPQVK